jgi:hypothetical protein
MDQISMSDMWQGISKYSENVFYKLKKMSRLNWALLLSLPFLYYILREEEA